MRLPIRGFTRLCFSLSCLLLLAGTSWADPFSDITRHAGVGDNGRGKWVFAEALRDVLPAEVLDRPKRGFEMPVAAWMRGPLRPVIDEALSPEAVTRRGLFDPGAVADVVAEFDAGRAPYLKLWSLTVLELWIRAFIDGDVPLA